MIFSSSKIGDIRKKPHKLSDGDEGEKRGEEEEERDEEEEEVKVGPSALFQGWVEVSNGIPSYKADCETPNHDLASDGTGDLASDSASDGAGVNNDEPKTYFKVNMDQISRLDRYGSTSECVVKRRPDIKHLCFCKSLLLEKKREGKTTFDEDDRDEE